MNTVSRHGMPVRIKLALLATVATFGCADPGIATGPEDLGLGHDFAITLEDFAMRPPDVAMVIDLSMPDLYMLPDLFVECDGGLAACNGACVDTQTSFEHCGMCGKACPGGWNCCGGTCSNPVDSIMNCGACGVVCKVAHGTPACAARLCTIANCDLGYADCVGGYKDGCETQTAVNVNNCGACNKACFFSHAQPACNGGKCGIDTCIGLWADCDGDSTNGCELDTGSDTKNCGKCGRVCPMPANATPACNGGMCGIGMCTMDFADCDGNSANGCEVNKATDVKNCGACGMICPAPANATPGCSAGTCGIGVCMGGFADCDAVAANGCEINTGTDKVNCGKCSNVCGTPPHGMPICNGGNCSFTCSQPWNDCDGNALNGCETDTSTAANACGACGRACTVPNATTNCSMSVCGIQSCQVGFGDCDKQYVNGCEQSLNTVNNCGGCGISCPTPPNATAGCTMGVCGIGSCAPNFADCDKNPANGCETSLQSDSKNCGACGNACQGTSCADGTCSLLAWYKFDEGQGGTIIDSAGTAHGTHSATYVAGKKNTALLFNGTTGGVIPGNLLAWGANNADFTVGYWIYINMPPTNAWRAVLHHGNVDIDRTSAHFVDPSSQALYAVVSTGQNWNDYPPTFMLAINQWIHIADVKEGNVHTIYQNGAAVRTAMIAPSVGNSGPLYIGKDPWYGGIQGMLDDVRIYTRARTPAQIQADMQ